MAHITYIRQGDLLASKMHTLVNTVNCVGVMGNGLALQFKQRYPECVPSYESRCRDHSLKPGKIMCSYAYAPTHLIVHAATKNHWRNYSQVEWIRSILKDIGHYYHEYSMESIALPSLGCGNGGLRWEIVGPIMAGYLQVLLPSDTQVEIYIKQFDLEY